MALNWRIDTIEDFHNICWIPIKVKELDDQKYMHSTTYHNEEKKEAGVLNPVTNQLIWATMIVGMFKITKKNWEEFYWRVHLYEDTIGHFLTKYENDKPVPYFITAKDIHNHIGLSTNADTITKTKFIRKIADIHREKTSFNIEEKKDD